jgi:DNA-binding NtrC family response regulator
MARLLVIGDGDVLGPALCQAGATEERWSCHSTDWSSFSFESLGRASADLIIASIASTQRQSLEFVHWLRRHPVPAPTIAVFPCEPTLELYRSCCDVVDDFIVWPFRPEELRHRIARLLPRGEPDLSGLRDRLSAELGLANLIGRHQAFLDEIARIPLAASSDGEVLITGETGTGKELSARAIHHLSRRRNLPMICVDCGALPDQLFENEMFGHVRGAFTDAHRAQKGLVALAEGGTLFLDEIDSLSMTGQTKLLRFLQDRSYRPLGSEQFARANVRIIAATNRDLEQAVQEKTFRRDLFFRINVLRLHMVPLRQRADDIEPLARHFLELCCVEMGGPRKTLSPSALQVLRSQEWPGNIRELYNTIRRAALFAEGPRLLPSHLLPPSRAARDDIALTFRDARRQAVSSFERRYVEDLLRKHGGNITRAAREANKDRRAFGRLVKRHEINAQGMR